MGFSAIRLSYLVFTSISIAILNCISKIHLHGVYFPCITTCHVPICIPIPISNALPSILTIPNSVPTHICICNPIFTAVPRTTSKCITSSVPIGIYIPTRIANHIPQIHLYGNNPIIAIHLIPIHIRITTTIPIPTPLIIPIYSTVSRAHPIGIPISSPLPITGLMLCAVAWVEGLRAD